MLKLSYLTVDWPLRQERLFPRAAALIVEIGFGNGEYLAQLAQARPDCNLLGLEISSQSLTRAEARIEKLGLQNARVMQCRAETALAHLLPPASVAEFHINYPDPWFKKKHQRRRLIQRKTLDYMASRLVCGGTLLLATDIRAYAEMADAALQASPGLDNLLGAPWLPDLPGRFRTKYERKGYREGRGGHFFRYRRNRQPVYHPPLIQELDMPHLFLHSPLNAPAIIDRFSPTRRHAAGAHIAILNGYANRKRDSAVFEVVVQEPTIEQRALISLSPREEPRQYIVKLTAVGHARPTAGMHTAVAAVGEWVAGLHEEGAVLARKVRG